MWTIIMRFCKVITLVVLLLLEGLTAASVLPRAKAQGTYKALYDFAGQATNECSLQKGELVIVVQQDASGTLILSWSMHIIPARV